MFSALVIQLLLAPFMERTISRRVAATTRFDPASRVLRSTLPLSHRVERHLFDGQFCEFYLFPFQTPHDSERFATFTLADDPRCSSALIVLRLADRGVYFFIVFQTPRDWVAAERVSFKLVSVLAVRKQVLFRLCEFRGEISSFLLRHFSRRFAGGLVHLA